VYGGKRLLALGGHGETEDGAVGVMGVDGGQGGMEGHLLKNDFCLDIRGGFGVEGGEIGPVVLYWVQVWTRWKIDKPSELMHK